MLSKKHCLCGTGWRKSSLLYIETCNPAQVPDIPLDIPQTTAPPFVCTTCLFKHSPHSSSRYSPLYLCSCQLSITVHGLLFKATNGHRSWTTLWNTLAYTKNYFHNTHTDNADATYLNKHCT